MTHSPKPESAIHAPAWAPKRWVLVLILAGMTSLGAFSVDFYLPGLPAIAAALHTDTPTVQYTMVSFMIGNAFGFLFFGPISDRFGRKPPLYLGLMLYVAASTGCALAGSIGWLIGLRFFQAVGSCAGMVIGRAIVRDMFRGKEAAHVYGLIMLVFAIAPMVAPVFGTYFLLWFGWPSLFWAEVGLAFALLVLVHFLLRETRPKHHVASLHIVHIFKNYGSLLVSRDFVGYAIGNSFGVGALITYISGSAHVVIDVYGKGPEFYGWLYGFNGVGVMIAARLSSILHHRFGVARVLRGAFAVQAAIALILLGAWLIDGSFWAFFIPIFFLLSLIGMISPSSTALAMESQPHRAGAASAVMGTLQFCFGALGTVLVSTFSNGTALCLILVIAVFSTIALLTNLFATPNITHSHITEA